MQIYRKLCHLGGSRGSKRDEMKTLIREMKKTNPTVDADIFRSITDINLTLYWGITGIPVNATASLTYYGAAALTRKQARSNMGVLN